MKDDLVILWNNQPMTTSRKVAEVFDKRHANVMRDIEAIIKNLKGLLKIEETPSENAEKLSYISMFKLESYTNEQNGENYPMYYLNRDGFTLLAMGFTGKKALAFKLKYIAAFNTMEQILKNIGEINFDNAAPSNDKPIDEFTVKEKFENLMKLAKVSPSDEQKINLINQAAKLLGVDFPICSTETFGKSGKCGKSRKYKHKLSDEQVRAIKQIYSQGHITIHELTKIYKVGAGTIHRAINQELKDDEYPF